MSSDAIKEAFAKVKEDILSLKSQINEISKQIDDFKRTLLPTDKPTDTQTDTENKATVSSNIPTHIPTDASNYPHKDLKAANSNISTGNGGVPTDRQTDRQTDKPTEKFAQVEEKNSSIDQIKKVTEIVNSLDVLKQDLRRQFKKLTPQEMLIFSTIYQMEEEGNFVDYSSLSKKLNLSESSIRDYVLKLTKKGVPLAKSKENNKKVSLSIPAEFKRIASLQTIISLRNL